MGRGKSQKMKYKKMSIGKLKDDIEKYPDNWGICASHFPLKDASAIILIDSDDPDEEKLPDSFVYIMGLYQVKDIVENLKLQGTDNIDTKKFLAAINFFIENDAYLVLNEH